MRKAEGQARDVEAFRARMDEAKVNAQKAIDNCNAGADLIVVGNAIEKNADLILEISKAVHSV